MAAQRASVDGPPDSRRALSLACAFRWRLRTHAVVFQRKLVRCDKSFAKEPTLWTPVSLDHDSPGSVASDWPRVRAWDARFVAFSCLLN